MGWFSCTSDLNDPQMYIRFQWDGSEQQEEFRPVNQGKASSSFAIDDNIISFAVPYLVGTLVGEHIPDPSWKGIEGYSPHLWTITLIMAKGTDVTSLAPIITLAPGATITWIHTNTDKQVDYTGIVEVGEYNFRQQFTVTLIATDGSQKSYMFLAVAIGDVLPCANCP